MLQIFWYQTNLSFTERPFAVNCGDTGAHTKDEDQQASFFVLLSLFPCSVLL